MIDSVKKFQTVCTLLDFLDSLGVKVSQNTHNVLSQDYGNYEPCQWCGEAMEDCDGGCNDDAPDYYADDYLNENPLEPPKK